MIGRSLLVYPTFPPSDFVPFSGTRPRKLPRTSFPMMSELKTCTLPSFERSPSWTVLPATRRNGPSRPRDARRGNESDGQCVSRFCLRVSQKLLRRPLERGLLAVGRQVRRRRIRVALFGAVELADLAEVDLRETNLDLLVLLIVELAVAQLAFHGKVRALF
jgi:hypothetical protein